MWKTIAAGLAGIGLALFAVSTAFAWESRIEGRPASFQAGSTAGVYFWHEGTDQGMHLRTTDPEGVEHWYTGEIYTDGTFADLDNTLLEKDDTASIGCSGQCINFRFHTFSGIDGINWYVEGGTWQTVDLQRDGRQLPVDNIFLGEDSVHPDNNPLRDTR